MILITFGLPLRMAKGKRSNGKRIEKICGSAYVALLSAAVSGTLNLNPTTAGWGRLTSIADCFGLFRFTKLRIRWVGPNATAADVAACVVTGTVDGFPATVGTVIQSEYYNINFADQTTPTILDVPRAYLVEQSPNKWWKTVAGTPDDWNEVQGVICAACSSSTTLNFVIDYEIELCDFLNPSNTPALEYKLVNSELGLYRRVSSEESNKVTSGVSPVKTGLAPVSTSGA